MSKALPRISIVTPCYNHAQFVERTVRTVFGQRYPQLEYIFMDGGSTDDTVARLDPYRAQFAHFESARDEGQSDAIARGFEKSSGEIMAYLNSDDMFAPGALHWVARFFADNPSIDVVYSHRVTVDEYDRAIWYWILPRHNDFLMSRWDLIPQETTFWRRSIWEKAGNVDKSFRFAMDYDLFVRFMRAGKLFRANRFLGAFRWHQAAKTSQLLETVGAREVKRVWRENDLDLPRGGQFLAERFWHTVTWAGGRHARSGRILPGGLAGLGYSYNDVWGGRLGPGAQ